MPKNPVQPKFLLQSGTVSFGFWPNNVMWTGTGPRSDTQVVKFPKSFKGTPSVFVAISTLDNWNGDNARTAVTAEAIDDDQFTVRIATWGNSKVGGVVVSWFAHGVN